MINRASVNKDRQVLKRQVDAMVLKYNLKIPGRAQLLKINTLHRNHGKQLQEMRLRHEKEEIDLMFQYIKLECMITDENAIADLKGGATPCGGGDTGVPEGEGGEREQDRSGLLGAESDQDGGGGEGDEAGLQDNEPDAGGRNEPEEAGK